MESGIRSVENKNRARWNVFGPIELPHPSGTTRHASYFSAGLKGQYAVLPRAREPPKRVRPEGWREEEHRGIHSPPPHVPHLRVSLHNSPSTSSAVTSPTRVLVSFLQQPAEILTQTEQTVKTRSRTTPGCFKPHPTTAPPVVIGLTIRHPLPHRRLSLDARLASSEPILVGPVLRARLPPIHRPPVCRLSAVSGIHVSLAASIASARGRRRDIHLLRP